MRMRTAVLFLFAVTAASQGVWSQQVEITTNRETATGTSPRNSSGVAIVNKSTSADRATQPGDSRFALRLIPTTVPPVIDGSLGDACWQNAPIISEFTQVEPREGKAPTEHTDVRVLYDESHLYFAIRCHDSSPPQIQATQMQRDGDFSSDDSIALIFDTFGRRRSGFFFATNPAGAMQEGLVDATGRIDMNWDTFWSTASRCDQEGWTAEIAIPFRSLSFDPKTTVWGFNVERTIRRKQEIVRWAFPFKNKSISSLADVGQLQDISGIRPRIGIEVRPFLAAHYLNQREGRLRDDFDFKPGVDAFLRIGSSVTAALTINTDFADAEVDTRQVNLTRFPLFFPEKRAFFLEDSNLFGFSTYNGPRAFYSRRIGLSPSGEAVDIIAGGKLAGRVGDLEFGLLDVQVDDSPTTPESNLAVARLSYRVLEESSVGAIFTHGSPRGTNENWLAGGDLNYRNSHVSGNNLLTARAWLLKSDEPRFDSRQMAFGLSATYPNEPFWIEGGFAQIDDDFNPGLGFVSRRGIRDYSAYTRYRWRPGGYVRTVDLEFAPRIVTNLDNIVETESWSAPSLTILNERGDQLYAGFISERENLSEGFEIQPGVLIPRGDYRFNRGFVVLSSTTARPISAYGSVSAGEFYDGSSQTYGAGIEWRASSHLFLSAQSELDRVDLPGGDFDVIVSSARLNVTFTPTVSWNTLVQYDNVSNSLGLYSRIKWTVVPGSDVYLVFKNGFNTEDGRFRSETTEVSLKAGYTFRF